MKTAVVDIFELSFDGAKGVGKMSDGKIVFIPRTSPGDKVKIKITQDKKSFCQGEVLEIIEPSPFRISPKCQIYKDCGGCQLQHIEYQTQINEKQNILKRYIEKTAPNSILHDFIASDEQWGYRNRLEVHFQNHQWGFYKRKTHELVPTSYCHIAKESLNNKLNSLKMNRGHVHVAESSIQDENGNHQVLVHEGRQRGIEGLFSQVNENVNQKLKSKVLEILKTLTWDLALDFFAGSGNFSSIIAELHPEREVHSVELSQALVKEGQEKWAHLSNIRWLQIPCENYGFNNKTKPQTLVLLDPPRTGCDAKWLTQLSQQSQITTMIYVSCNPPLLFRDLKILREQFELVSLQGFDMFPQTMHFEAIAILNRKN